MATLIVAVPDFVPLVPVIVACPDPTAVTVAVNGPVAVTVATPGVPLANVTVDPAIGFPELSVTSAVSVCCCPTSRFDDCGEMTTALIGTACTVNATAALAAPLVAVIVSTPTFTPVTTPFASTVETAGFDDDHVMARPVSTLPAESWVVADSCVESWTITEGFDGAITIFLTGTRLTVTLPVPLALPELAVMVTVPRALASTRPAWSTGAIVVSLLDHTTVRPVRTLPDASFVVSVNWNASPTRSVTEGGATMTFATGTETTMTRAGCVGETPAVLASMLTAPTATAVTLPLWVTLAIVGSLVDQNSVWPLTCDPLAVTGCAWMVAVSPIAMFNVSGVITMSVMPWEFGPVASWEQATAIPMAMMATADHSTNLTQSALCRSDTTAASIAPRRVTPAAAAMPAPRFFCSVVW